MKKVIIPLSDKPPSAMSYGDRVGRYGNVIVVFENGAVGVFYKVNVTTTVISCEYSRKFTPGSGMPNRMIICQKSQHPFSFSGDLFT